MLCVAHTGWVLAEDYHDCLLLFVVSAAYRVLCWKEIVKSLKFQGGDKPAPLPYDEVALQNRIG